MVAKAKTKEIWRTIAFNERYEVSNLGRVRNAETKQIKKQNFSYNRPYVGLYDPNRYTCHRVLVSKIVSETFLGPKPEGMQVEHIDQDSSNNAVTNLLYVTPSQNQLRSYALTDRPRHSGPDLDQESYDMICELWETGNYSQVSIGKMLGISNAAVSRIVNGKREARGKHRLMPPTPEDLEKYKKPEPKIDLEEVQRLRDEGWSGADIARHFDCTPGYIYRVWNKLD
ncbi:MAG: HNH endonuclease [Planctomycetaceae bacterium]|nr:HNH endonuclease [Planctomycetaceae bacterium]